MIQSFRTGLALSVVFLTVAGWAKEVTLTVDSDADLATQLSAEGKTLADGDTLVKEGDGQLTMDQDNGALLSGGTVKAGTLAANPKNGLGKAYADWTVEDGATIRIGGSGSYVSNLKLRLSGTGCGGAGALAVYDNTSDTTTSSDFFLNDDATINVCAGNGGYTGLFTYGHLRFGGHALTLKGAVSQANIRQRLGGQVYDSGTLVLDAVIYSSGGVTDASYAYDAGKRTMRLKNGATYRVNVQKQFEAYETYDGAAGTTLKTDSGTLAAATFKNLTGSPTLDASLLAVTVSGVLTARGTDLVSGTCLDCRQAVTFGSGATFDLVDGETVESGREHAVATATGGFSGPLPRVVGRAYRRQAVLRLSEDGKALFATFGDPVARDFGAVSAWYRFDDLPVGTTLGNGAPVINEVDPLLGVGNVTLLDKTASALTGIAPRTAPPSELTEVYDPLTGVTFSNRASLELSTEAYSASSTKGAEILVPGDGSNHPEKSVTLEAFVCSTGGVYNVMVPIVSLTRGSETTDESLALLVNADGFICARYRTRNMASANIWQHTRTAGTRLFDGHWHHVALVYDADAEEGRLSMYVDYQFDKSIGVDKSGLLYADDESASRVYLGGYHNPDGRKFNGRIDEVRIVGAALAPENFLRRRRPAPSPQGIVDEQTLFFCPMAGGTTGEAARDDVNGVTNTPAAYVRTSSGGVPAFDADAPAPGVRGSHRRMASTAAGSLPVGGTGGSEGSVIAQDAYLDWFGDDLTIEGFFKTSVRQDAQTILGFGGSEGYVLKLMVHDGSKLYLAGNAPGWWGGAVTAGSVADGAWHHFAVVFDKSAGTFTTEIDGTVSTKANLGAMASARLTIGASRATNGGFEQAFSGKVGPVRITRGKLKPCAWMGAVDPAEADPTMRDGVAFHLRGLTAEGLLDVQPYPSSRTPGETAVLSVAGAAAPSFTASVRQPQYFLYGEEAGLMATNTGSVHLQNSALVFRGDRALDAGSQTIECLAKFTSIGSSAHLFRLGMTEGANAEGAALRVITYMMNGKLVVSMSADKDGKADYFDRTTSIAASELTGGWHHLALSWDEDAADGMTTVRVYLDYQLRNTFVTDRRIWHPATLTRHSLAIGYSNPVTNEGLVGDIDEFRITEGVLQPEAFIRKVPRHLGLLMIVR